MDNEKVCTQYLKSGKCRYGDKCRFVHKNVGEISNISANISAKSTYNSLYAKIDLKKVIKIQNYIVHNF